MSNPELPKDEESKTSSESRFSAMSQKPAPASSSPKEALYPRRSSPLRSGPRMDLSLGLDKLTLSSPTSASASSNETVASSPRSESIDSDEAVLSSSDESNEYSPYRGPEEGGSKSEDESIFADDDQNDKQTVPDNIEVFEKGTPRLERKLSRTISSTWNAIDEHEEKKANKLDHSGLENVLMRRLSKLTCRASRLQILADGSRDKKFIVPDDYDGPKLPAPPNLPTQQHAEKMILAFRQAKLLHYRYAHELVGRVTDIHRNQALNIQRIQLPPDVKLTIVGDLHGQLQDLLAILEFQGLPSPTNWYLFNGDFVDRGTHSIEVLWIIYVFKIMYPDCVWLNRGNHEHRLLNKRYKFERQVKNAYDERMYERIATSFDVLPLCTIINKEVFVVHGGLTEYPDLMLSDIEKIPLAREVPRDILTKEDKIMKQLVWSDPWTQGEDKEEPTIRTHGFAQNSRGAGIVWAPSITMKFLERNRLRLIVRSHQMVDEGFKYHHSHHVVTLFSASYYCGKNENRGAIAVFENGSTKSIKYIQYCADPLTAVRTPEVDAAMAERTIKQTLQKLAETIYHKRYKLLIGFSKKDTDYDGIITINDWVSVLESVIKINLRWHDLWIEIFAPKDDPQAQTIKYRDFLERFSLDLDSKLLRLWQHQQESVAANVCEKILAKSNDLRHAYETLLVKTGGIISCADFCQLLLDSDLGLSRNAAADFTCTIDTDKNGTIDYEEFFQRFKKQFKITTAHPEVSRYIRQLGDAIYGSKGTSQKKAILKSAWTTLPKTPQGDVDMEGFQQVLTRLRVECSDETRNALFEYINSSGSGQISEMEFRKAFAFRALESSAVLRVFTLVQKYSHDLGVAFVGADSLGQGEIDEEEFVSAVSSVLEVKNILDIPEKDISALFKAVSDEGTQTLKYQSTLQSFRITFK